MNTGLPNARRSQAVDDYLKAIWRLGNDGQDGVGTAELARALGVSPPSATQMVNKLSALRLVRRARRRGVHLTQAGRLVALRVVRGHRIVESFLAQVLGMGWERVHEEAERWEHVVSDEALQRMEATLGNPSADVHGHPIPDAQGNMPTSADLALDELAPGRRATVSQVSDHSPELLTYLRGLGIRPGVRILLRHAGPFGGPLELEVEGEPRRLGREAAPHVRVRGELGRR